MKKILVASLCATSLFHTPLAFAQAPAKGISETNVVSTGSKAPSVKDSADQSAKSNSSGQIMSVLTAGLMFTQAYPHYGACSSGKASSCVKAAILTGMGLMSLKQAKEHGSAAASAGLTSGLTDGSGAYDYGAAYGSDTAKNPDIKAANDAFNKIKNTGMVNTSKGTITTPDGKKYKDTDFASEKSMAAAGIPSGAIKGALANAAALGEKAAAKTEKIVGKSEGTSEDSFGGGGGGSTTVVTVDDEAGMGGGAGKGLGSGLKRDPAQLAGMQKNYNGEPIGVAADSIFLMMNRRYQFKQSQDSFLTEMDLRLQK